ncbi:hypothetical protein NPIL_72371 [Nephila pilipes]|uniref:Uncharacterized protein n=1 Tax=Nephila pilipes TaxID=299642 RepID=A0A8X6NIN2_NEPPI|nr:hypothetical protein NPIL_72371 [Nephila pilipes]
MSVELTIKGRRHKTSGSERSKPLMRLNYAIQWESIQFSPNRIHHQNGLSNALHRGMVCACLKYEMVIVLSLGGERVHGPLDRHPPSAAGDDGNHFLAIHQMRREFQFLCGEKRVARAGVAKGIVKFSNVAIFTTVVHIFLVSKRIASNFCKRCNFYHNLRVY